MKKLLNNPWFSGPLALLALALVASSVMEESGFVATPSYFDLSSESEDSEAEETLVGPAPAGRFDPAGVEALASQMSSRHLFERKEEVILPTQTEPEAQVLAEGTVRVKGIWIQNDIRYVIIDDQTLQSGQSIERVRVERIEEQGVWLSSTPTASTQDSHYVKPGESWTYVYPKPKDSLSN